MRIVLLSWVRETVRHPTLAILSVIGVALGVATVVAVDIANESARVSFLTANATIAGTTTHRITGRVTDELYHELRIEQELNVVPVVEGMVNPVSQESARVRLYGVDLLAEFNDDSNQAWQTAGLGNATALISNPFTFFTTEETANLHDWAVDDRIVILSATGETELQLIGLLETSNPLQAQSLRNLLLTDISTAQAVLGKLGYLTAINATFDGSFDLEAFEQTLPDDVRVENQSDLRDSQLALTEAFQVNLTALGLLAFLVAIFLIYNTISYTVARRRRHIGLLRAIGVQRNDVLYCVLFEVLAMGITATVVGFLIGMQLSEFLLKLVERSIDTLYFPISAGVTVLSTITVVKATLLGVGATVISALPSIKYASLIAPSIAQHQLHADSAGHTSSLRLAMTGIAAAVLGAIVLVGNQRSIVLGFTGIFFCILGYLALVPLLTDVCKRITSPLSKHTFGIQGVLMLRAFSSRPGQTSATIAVLCLALSATIGVDIMVSSFRHTVDELLTNRLRGDIYVTLPSDAFTGFQTEDIQSLQNIAGIASVGVAKWTDVPDGDGSTNVFAADYGEQAFRGFQFKHQSDVDVWEAFQNGAVIISEPYSYRTGLGVDDTVELFNGRVPKNFPIVGVFYDYSSQQGVVAMHRPTYIDHFEDDSISSLSVNTHPEADLEEVAQAIERQFAQSPATVWRNQELHDASMLVFDQTFTITYVLRILAIIVAFVAVLSALATLQIERERELVIFRTMGFTSKQNWSLISAESGVMGGLAGLLSIPIGIIMAWLLIWVIEQRSFGWTMKMLIDPLILMEAVALAVAAALIAGGVSAWRQVRRVPALALQSGD